MKIAITGASGFVGTHLVKALELKGHEIKPLNRVETAIKETLSSKIEGCEAIINLAGAPIVHRWDEEYKKTLFDSRIDTTLNLIHAISELKEKPKVFISTSAIGAYDNRETYTEEDAPNARDFLGHVAKEWEKAALKAEDMGIRTVIFRFSVVLGKDGGMMAKLKLPFKFGVGGVIGDGSQHFSWVHVDDIVSAELRALTDSTLSGIYNLTSPNPVTNRIFTKTLGEVMHRPTRFPVPVFVLKIIFGEGAHVLADGQSVIPKRLMDSGFTFKYSEIREALKEIVS